jgi:hypothetical protein
MTNTQPNQNTEAPSAIEKLIAKAEMYDVLMRYCQGVDRSDPDLVASVYWEDGYDDHGTMFQGPGWEFAKFFEGAPGKVKPPGAMHVIGNHYVEFEGPDLAFSEAYYITMNHSLVDEKTEQLFTFWGRYLDRFERRNGEWRTAHRICLHEWNRTERYEAQPDYPGVFAAPFVQGSGKPDDILYNRQWLMEKGSRPGANPTDPPVYPGREGRGPLD